MTLTKRIIQIWVNYLKGQFLLMLIISGLTYIGAKLLGLPYALPLAIVAGICENIPTFGPILAGIPAVIIALWRGSDVLTVENWIFALIILGLIVLIQLLENWILVPRVHSRSVGIHPLIILIGMAGFSFIFGIVGMLIAVPVMASVREIVRTLFYDA